MVMEMFEAGIRFAVNKLFENGYLEDRGQCGEVLSAEGYIEEIMRCNAAEISYMINGRM